MQHDYQMKAGGSGATGVPTLCGREADVTAGIAMASSIGLMMVGGDVLHSFLEAPSGDAGGLVRDQPEDRTCEL
jgi:hypothetical protein